MENKPESSHLQTHSKYASSLVKKVTQPNCITTSEKDQLR